MHTILFTACTFSDEKIKDLQSKGLAIIKAKNDLTEAELITALNDVEGYILSGDEIATKKVIESADMLKIIAFFGAGYENYIDTPAATAKGIVVTNTPRVNAHTVAEHTSGLILDAVKKLTYLNNRTKSGVWEKPMIWNLHDKTCGIIGMGAVGNKVARMMHQGFGMNIVYTSRTPKPEIEQELGATMVSLKELLTISDVVSIHTSLTSQTHGLIKQEELSWMKPSAVLINCARAELVDGHSLYQALTGKKIACAAFDNYYQEPAPSPDKDMYKLMSLSDDLFLLTPHNAYHSKEAVEAMEAITIENLVDFFDGKKPKNQVNAA